MSSEFEEIKKALGELNSTVNEINKKTSNKWVFPIVMLVLTTFATYINYFLQKNNDIDNTDRKIYAEVEAKDKIDFYKSAKNKVEDLSESFELYCFYKDSFSNERLNQEFISFYELYNKQLINDKTLIVKMKNYSRYISETSIDLQYRNVNHTHIKSILKRSNKLKKEVLLGIDSGLKKLK